MKVSRLTRERYAGNGYTGFGSALYGQRWNSKGVYVIYAASSMALAQLELLVHVRRDLSPDDFVSVTAIVPEDGIDSFDVAALPTNWRHEPPPLEFCAIGDRLIREARRLPLRVPSAVSPDDSNILINPRHPRFGEVVIAAPKTLTFDPRFFT